MESRRATITKSLEGPNPVLRPVLTSINGDNAWLLSFPRPAADRQKSGKAFYHVASEAWLKGTGVPVVWEFMAALRLVTKPACGDGDDVEDVVREIEDTAASAGFIPKTQASGSDKSGVDAIFINFNGPDHLSEATLRTFNSSIPVFAIPEACSTIRSWKFFDTVVETKNLDPANGNWRELHPGSPLPKWLSTFRLKGPGMLFFATVIVYSPEESQHEALVWTPHGIKPEEPSVKAFVNDLTPNLSTLAMMHSLKDSFAWGVRTTLGVTGGLALERAISPKYWVKTHNSDLDYRGLIMLGVKDSYQTLDWALEEEAKKNEEKSQNLKRPNFVQVDNGGCFVLQ